MSPAPRVIDADTYIQVWSEGHAARGTDARCPYDPHEQPGHYRAWIKGKQAALFGNVSETPGGSPRGSVP